MTFFDKVLLQFLVIIYFAVKYNNYIVCFVVHGLSTRIKVDYTEPSETERNI